MNNLIIYIPEGISSKKVANYLDNNGFDVSDYDGRTVWGYTDKSIGGLSQELRRAFDTDEAFYIEYNN